MSTPAPLHCICKTCSELKPAESFFRNKKNKTGRNTHECKACYSARANLETSRPPAPLEPSVARKLMAWLLGRKPAPEPTPDKPAPKPKARKPRAKAKAHRSRAK